MLCAVLSQLSTACVALASRSSESCGFEVGKAPSWGGHHPACAPGLVPARRLFLRVSGLAFRCHRPGDMLRSSGMTQCGSSYPILEGL